MLASKAIFSDRKIAFHAYLFSERSNSLVSTLPYELIKSHFQKELFHIENALLVNQKMADRMLSEFTELILQNTRFKPYFYPSFLTNGGVNFNTAEKLIHLQDSFVLKSGMCYSSKLNPIEFFHLQQQFNLNKRYIMKSCKYLSLKEFTAKCLINSTAQFCFREYNQLVEYVLEFDDEAVECAGVLDLNKDLKMLVTV
jgi:hypothetical protein